MTDLAPLKLLAAGGSGGEKTYQYPEEVYCSELASGGQMNFPGVTVSGTVTTSNTNPYSTSFDIAGYYSWIFNGTGSITLPQSTDHMNDLTGGGFFICFWMKTDVYSQESSEDRTIFVQDIGTGSNYANKLKIGITSAQKIAVFKTIDLGGTPIITSTTSVCDDAWHFVNVCRQQGSSTIRLFIDGNADGTVTDSTTFGTVNVNANGPQPAIGSSRSQTGRYSGSLHSMQWTFHHQGSSNSVLNGTTNYTPYTYPYPIYWINCFVACDAKNNNQIRSWTHKKVIGPRVDNSNIIPWTKCMRTESTNSADEWPVMHPRIINDSLFDRLWPANALDKISNIFGYRNTNKYEGYGDHSTRDYVNNKGVILGDWSELTAQDLFSYVHRTFRPAKGFCDILTYEGTGSVQNIGHNLGCSIGFMLIKDIDADVGWVAKHANHSGADYYQRFDEHANQVSDSTLFNSTASTSTQFTVGTSALTNTSGHTYIAILFADGSDGSAQIWGPSSNQKMVDVGYYNGNGSTTGPIVNVGFEPTTLILKGVAVTGGTAYWYIFDACKKFEAREEGVAWIEYNEYWDKLQATGVIQQKANGFQIRGTSTSLNENGGVYLYVAFRGPMRVPNATYGDKPSHFFNCAYGTANTSDVVGSFPGATNAPNFQPDFCMLRNPSTSSYQYVATRKSGYYYRATNNYSGIDTASSWMEWAVEPGFGTDWNTSMFAWMWKSAPGLTHVEYYKGTGSAQNITHNLGAVPEMMMCWRLGPQGTPTYTAYWHKGLNNGSSPENYFVYAQYSLGQYDVNVWDDTAPTSTVFRVNTQDMVNKSGDEYSMVLFASLAGFQKVGFYEGNGSAGKVIDCGFTTGSRFVMIKRTETTGNWKQYDTTRGLSSSVSMNCNANDYTAQSDDDFLRQHNTGFELNTSDAEVNANGGYYIYLAVANDPT